jgi:hypothetical protein
MGTRSIIIIKDSFMTMRLYKRWDGYPTANLALIAKGVKKAKDIATEHAERYYPNHGKLFRSTLKRYKDVKVIADCLMTESLGLGGFDLTYDARHFETFKAAHLGNREDVDWVYVLDVEALTLKVYAGNAPSVKKRLGSPTNPLSYTKQLIPDRQQEEAKEIMTAITELANLGVVVNPRRKVDAA